MLYRTLRIEVNLDSITVEPASQWSLAQTQGQNAAGRQGRLAAGDQGQGPRYDGDNSRRWDGGTNLESDTAWFSLFWEWQ
jgi:hypothetical protein